MIQVRERKFMEEKKFLLRYFYYIIFLIFWGRNCDSFIREKHSPSFAKVLHPLLQLPHKIIAACKVKRTPLFRVFIRHALFVRTKRITHEWPRSEIDEMRKKMKEVPREGERERQKGESERGRPRANSHSHRRYINPSTYESRWQA